MAAGMARLQEIEQNVEHDAVNSEKYIKELSKVCWEMFRATGAMFEQEHLRFINMFTAAGSKGETEEVAGTPRPSWRTRSSRT